MGEKRLKTGPKEPVLLLVLMAMFAAVRLLPSEGFALVMAKVEQGRSLSAVMQNNRLVRSFT